MVCAGVATRHGKEGGIQWVPGVARRGWGGWSQGG